MTTLVYRGGVLAADSQSDIGGWKTPTLCQKLFELPGGRISGIAGNRFCANRLIKWLSDDAGDRPKLDEETIVIVVWPDLRVQTFVEGYDLFERPEFLARGSGAPPALGALYMGASAEDAVRVASLVDPYTGGAIQTLSVRASE